ncbi:hypothetical protein C2I18_16775 [Paenibacillus sp. PK3_47]|uniref:hypothetical protein n=1 Tax=Paenibacillus sp. PK3_47 TaxID=2072642 RepID=UPI00201D35BE|nr:hypothetical protein [Paenibacillus sp. PK3_47]UQZ35030.1 hypothetical protein C2I18_16775 [Paenibacillus sp. PK3_47]
MNKHGKPDTGKVPDEEGMVTERDIDEEFGLFQEGSFPDALPDDDQQAAINHAVPKPGADSE